MLAEINIKKLFYENNIEIINQDFINKTPKYWLNSWINKFFIFDKLNYISLNLKENDNIIILEYNWLIMKNLYNIFKEIDENKCISYDTGYICNYEVDRITRNDVRI